MAERIDNTGFGDIRVIQIEGLGYGIDAVLLAAFAAGETGAKRLSGKLVADLGSGSGIVGFILCHKIPDISVVGYDKRTGSIDRAQRAAEMNGLTDRIVFRQTEIANGITDGKYDAVVSNPPYFRQDAAIPSATDDKFIARHETSANIYDWMKTASQALERGGDVYMVHRPDRLADIFQAMRDNGIEPKELQFVVPKAGEAANIVLIHAIKGAGTELKLLPEIAVHTKDGEYTELIMRIYERN